MQLSKSNRCPNKACRRKLDGAKSFDRTAVTPRAGDVSICAYCETMVIFTDDLSLEFLDESKESSETMAHLHAMLAYIQYKKKVSLH